VFGSVLADHISHARDDRGEFVEIWHIGTLRRRFGVLLHDELARFGIFGDGDSERQPMIRVRIVFGEHCF
jgi:hypothetical protein